VRTALLTWHPRALQVAPGDCRHTATLLCRAARHSAATRLTIHVYEARRRAPTPSGRLHRCG
jgi:hypothetical protein